MKSNNKILILSLFILFAILTSGILIRKYLIKTTDTYLAELKKVEFNITNDNWSEAEKRLEKLESNWMQTQSKWGLFTDHKEIDNITISLKSTTAYVKSKNFSQSLASLRTLQHYLSHIPNMEAFTLENIF
ncbi:hypothetical protein Q428_04400 [Fervidicella metallireducens AeB]|uniref:DUF4363 domain-containing protein n=1 Tax=Fervidicella metallireducens AeB TaxID=1403537 RepID=A0A017RWQ9_9CLOT|nr:DUF4363 family protein [Fervidicella metallireducens]EYE89092.1 hypothetical protein Q428_04400 [Fervidicella metallireducens AeB]